MSTKTPEQIEAEKAAKAAAKAAEKEAAAAKKAEEKAAKAAQKESDKAAKIAAKAAEKESKIQAKAEAKAAREANRQPEQNGVRRPKPDSLCGKAWAIFDDVSAKKGSPAAISEAMGDAKAQGLNEGNVKAEYARWRKFHGVSGRVTATPATPAPAAVA